MNYKVRLDIFEGPFDLLVYLKYCQNLFIVKLRIIIAGQIDGTCLFI